MAAYWIARATFHDMKLLKKYAEIGRGLGDKYPHELLSRDAKFVELEGKTHFEHYYLWKYPTMEMALELYHSPQYQAATEIRKAAGTSELVILDGGDHFSGKFE